MESETTLSEKELLFNKFKQYLFSETQISSPQSLFESLFAVILKGSAEEYQKDLQDLIEIIEAVPPVNSPKLHESIGFQNHLKLCFLMPKPSPKILINTFGWCFIMLTPQQLGYLFVMLSLNRPLHSVYDLGFYIDINDDKILKEALITFVNLFLILGKESRALMLQTLKVFLQQKDASLYESCEYRISKQRKMAVCHQYGCLANQLLPYQYAYPAEIEPIFTELIAQKEVTRIIRHLYLSFLDKNVSDILKIVNPELAHQLETINLDEETLQIKKTLEEKFSIEEIIHFLYQQYLVKSHYDLIDLTHQYAKALLEKLNPRSFDFYSTYQLKVFSEFKKEIPKVGPAQIKILRKLRDFEKLSVFHYQVSIMETQSRAQRSNIVMKDPYPFCYDALKRFYIDGLNYIWTGTQINTFPPSFIATNQLTGLLGTENDILSPPILGFNNEKIKRFQKRANYQPYLKTPMLNALSKISRQDSTVEARSIEFKKIDKFQTCYIENLIKNLPETNLNWLYFLMLTGIKIERKQSLSSTTPVILEAPVGIFRVHVDKIINMIFVRESANMLVKSQLYNLLNPQARETIDNIAFILIKEKIKKLPAESMNLMFEYLKSIQVNFPGELNISKFSEIPVPVQFDFGRILKYISLHPEKVDAFLECIPSPTEHHFTEEWSLNEFLGLIGDTPLWSLIEISKYNCSLASYLLAGLTRNTPDPKTLYQYLTTGKWNILFDENNDPRTMDNFLAIAVLLNDHPEHINLAYSYIKAKIPILGEMGEDACVFDPQPINELCVSDFHDPLRCQLLNHIIRSSATLNKISFFNMDVTDMASSLKSSASLSKIVFYNCPLTEDTFIHLIQLEASETVFVNGLYAIKEPNLIVSEKAFDVLLNKLKSLKQLTYLDLSQCVLTLEQIKKVLECCKNLTYLMGITFKDTNLEGKILDNLNYESYMAGLRFAWIDEPKLHSIILTGNLLKIVEHYIHSEILAHDFVTQFLNYLSNPEKEFLLNGIKSGHYLARNKENQVSTQNPAMIAFMLLCIKYASIASRIHNIISMPALTPIRMEPSQNLSDAEYTENAQINLDAEQESLSDIITMEIEPNEPIQLEPTIHAYQTENFIPIHPVPPSHTPLPAATKIEFRILPFSPEYIQLLNSSIKETPSINEIAFFGMNLGLQVPWLMKHCPHLKSLVLKDCFITEKALTESLLLIPICSPFKCFEFSTENVANQSALPGSAIIEAIIKAIHDPCTQIIDLNLSRFIFNHEQIAQLATAFYDNPNVLNMKIGVCFKNSVELNTILCIPSTKVPSTIKISTLPDKTRTPVILDFNKVNQVFVTQSEINKEGMSPLLDQNESDLGFSTPYLFSQSPKAIQDKPPQSPTQPKAKDASPRL